MDFNFKSLLVILGLGIVGAYFLPSIIAFKRNKRNRWTIFWLDLLLGWTVIGWIVTMVWALGTDAPQSTPSAG